MCKELEILTRYVLDHTNYKYVNVSLVNNELLVEDECKRICITYFDNSYHMGNSPLLYNITEMCAIIKYEFGVYNASIYN